MCTNPGEAEAQSRLLAQRGRTSEPMGGGGDAEADHGSSRGTLQAGLENESRAKTLSQKDSAAHGCDRLYRGTRTQRSLSELA